MHVAFFTAVLLISSTGCELIGIGIPDSLGAVVSEVISFKEGRDAFEKAKDNLICACHGNCNLIVELSSISFSGILSGQILHLSLLSTILISSSVSPYSSYVNCSNRNSEIISGVPTKY